MHGWFLFVSYEHLLIFLCKDYIVKPVENKKRNTTFGRVAVGSVLVVFTILLMVSFYTVNNRPEDTRFAQEEADQRYLFGSEQGQDVNLGDITDNPEGYYGQLITLRGDVEKNLGTRGIIIESKDSDEEVLVVSRDSLVGIGGGPGEVLYHQNDDVIISGTVQEFKISDIQQELGIDLNNDDFAQFEGRPVVIADEISEVLTR